MSKTAQLQIRVSRAEKAAIRRAAREAGQGISAYILARVLPRDSDYVAGLMDAVGHDDGRSHALAELNDWLSRASAREFVEVVSAVEVSRLPPLWRNYVAAMVELAASLKEVQAPAWTAAVPPLDEPYFATDLKSLRPHLLVASPTPFKRRNLFIDSSIGDRV